MQPHLDLLELELIRTGEAEAVLVAHLESCDACRESLNGLETVAADLSSSAQANVPIPDSVDQAVLAIARKSAARVADRRRFIRRWRWPAAAAAAAALVVSLAGILRWESPAPVQTENTTRAPALAADIDGDGSIDIVDALVLAKRIRNSESLEPSWDFNHDGKVDRGDVDTIARRVVSVKGAQS